MMNINKKLFDKINFYNYNLEDNRTDIEHFLNYNIPVSSNLDTCYLNYDAIFDKRCNEAIEIINNIMLKHDKDGITPIIKNLAKVESGTRTYVRDHVVHAMLTFIVGIYINENFFDNRKVEPFQWKLASLFHDIGYPIEICSKHILKPFADSVNDIRSLLGSPSNIIDFKINIPDNISKLTRKNSFDLIQECLNKWDIQINVKEEYNQMIKKGKIRHGVISSLLLLNAIDLMYQEKHETEEKCNRIIVPACSAIYIHDRESKDFTKKINRQKAPIAFLLRLSDCLQEWERPKFKNPTGFLATMFDIEATKNQLIYKYKFLDNDELKNNIMKEILALEYQHQEIQINP